MTLHIRAHFDSRVLVPDQPVDLPVNQPLDVEVTPCGVNGKAGAQIPPSPEVIRERLRKLDEFFRLPPLAEIPLEALRRQNLYEDRV